MLSKFSIIFFIVFSGIYFSSCNSNENKKTENTDNVEKTTSVDSISIYEKMLAKDSANLSLRNALAIKYYIVKDYDLALANFKKVYNADNKNIFALVNIGNVYYDKEMFTDAIKYYEKALIIDSTNTNVRCDVATCYLNSKQPAIAMALLKKNIAMDFNHAQSHHNLSVVYEDLGMVVESKEEMVIYNRLIGKK